MTRRRSDIQGLRALAVLAVVAFHANLPVFGGFVGLFVGQAFCAGIGVLLRAAPVMSTDTAIKALIFAAGTGLVFGMYPAIRASRLNPIEALRTE